MPAGNSPCLMSPMALLCDQWPLEDKSVPLSEGFLLPGWQSDLMPVSKEPLSSFMRQTCFPPQRDMKLLISQVWLSKSLMPVAGQWSFQASPAAASTVLSRPVGSFCNSCICLTIPAGGLAVPHLFPLMMAFYTDKHPFT